MTKTARNADYTKEYNRKLFLRLLRNEPLSRSEIARRMGVTRAATSLIAEELMARGYIVESFPGDKPLGRTPVPLRLIGDNAWAVGIYLNRDHCQVGLVNLTGQVRAQRDFSPVVPTDLERLAAAVTDMLQQQGVPADKVVGVGVSAPGPLDGENGRILNPPGFEAWHNFAIVERLQALLPFPVYLANNAAALAQYCLGKPETGGSENYLLLLVDSGLGSGVIIRGKALKGAGFFTGELGHTSIDLKGKRCTCGNRGCLEAYAAIPHLLKGSDFDSWQQVMDRESTDLRAARLVQQELAYLTAGVVNMANLISIDTVLLAGDLLYKADRLLSALEQAVNEKILRRDILPIRVRASCSGPDAPLQSAADIAFDWFLRI